MAKRRKNPPDTAMLLTVAGGALLYLLLRKKEPAAPIAVPPEHAKQVQENLNRFTVPGQGLPVTGVYDEATANRLVSFANWVDAAMKSAKGAVGLYALLSAKNGLFHNQEIVMLQVGDQKQQTTRSTYDYLFTRPVADPSSPAESRYYTLDDQKYMKQAEQPTWGRA